MNRFWHTHKHSKWVIFGLAIFVGLALRLLKIGVYPPGFSWDEAAITYDAWGISLDGHDSWGNYLPLTFVSFGDYKAPLVVYVVALIDKIAGMHYLTVRYVSAFCGVGLIWMTYLIVKQLAHKQDLAMLSSMLVALAPEAIHVSRVGFEANVAILLQAIALYSLLISRRQARYWWVFIGASGLAMYTYQSMKIVVPLIVISVIVWGIRSWPTRKQLLVGFFGFIVLCLPLFMNFSQQIDRGTQTLLFYNNGHLYLSFGTFYVLIKNVLLNIDPKFWVMGIGTNWRNHVIYWGLTSPIVWIGILLGLYYGWKQKSKAVGFLVFLIGINLVPSILSADSPHYLRALGVFPYAQILGAFGLLSLLGTPKTNRYIFGRVVLGGLVIGLTTAFVYVYTHIYKDVAASAFAYGYQEAMEVVKAEKPEVEHIFITDSLGQPYIFYLLFTGITPADFVSGATANVTFGPIGMPLTQPHSLYVGTPNEMSSDMPEVIQTITYPNKTKVALVVAKTP